MELVVTSCPSVAPQANSAETKHNPIFAILARSPRDIVCLLSPILICRRAVLPTFWGEACGATSRARRFSRWIVRLAMVKSNRVSAWPVKDDLLKCRVGNGDSKAESATTSKRCWRLELGRRQPAPSVHLVELVGVLSLSASFCPEPWPILILRRHLASGQLLLFSSSLSSAQRHQIALD